MIRFSYQESVAELKRRAFLSAEEDPVMLPDMPSPEDEDSLGLSFFRTRVEGDLSGLSIPRTLFCRSEVCDCLLVGTDLSESFLCWNDVTDSDFTSAILKNADLRSSVFVRVSFNGADLSGADLRHANFEDCDFTDAVMTRAKVARPGSSALAISVEQKNQIEWSAIPGDQPPGG